MAKHPAPKICKRYINFKKKSKVSEYFRIFFLADIICCINFDIGLLLTYYVLFSIQHSIVVFRYVNLINTAIKENGNITDPTQNSSLARVIKDAQAENVQKVMYLDVI